MWCFYINVRRFRDWQCASSEELMKDTSWKCLSWHCNTLSVVIMPICMFLDVIISLYILCGASWVADRCTLTVRKLVGGPIYYQLINCIHDLIQITMHKKTTGYISQYIHITEFLLIHCRLLIGLTCHHSLPPTLCWIPDDQLASDHLGKLFISNSRHTS